MVSGQTLVAASLGEQTTPGFTVFNVRRFVKLTDNLLVSAGVDNLGDRTYREHLDPIAGNLLGSGALLRPGANFFLNTQWTY
jgi:outer membrane receptor protein involved in Fe transport